MLVEGMSDRRAVETLASRQGRDLDGEGVSVVAIGGAQAIGASLQTYGPNGLGLRLAGLCDAAEERHYARALERAGLGTDLDRDRLETLGFYVCESDLEDELIRALGAATVERIVATQGELGPFRTFQKQPAQRSRAIEAQLHRFLGTGSGRKIQYGSLLVEALDLARVPRPLQLLLAHV